MQNIENSTKLIKKKKNDKIKAKGKTQKGTMQNTKNQRNRSRKVNKQ